MKTDRFVFPILLLMFAPSFAFGQVQERHVQDLPNDLIEQFEAAHAEYGHFLIDEKGGIEFETDQRRFRWWRDSFKEPSVAGSRFPVIRVIPGFELPSEFSDADAAKLPTTTELIGLSVCFSDFSDKGIRDLARLSHVQLFQSRIMSDLHDAEIRFLDGLEHLEMLEVQYPNPRVRHSELVDLSHMKNLQVLSLQGIELKAVFLNDVAAMNNLEALKLKSIRSLDAAGIQRLAGLARLKTLNLSSCDVEDRVAAALSKLDHLESLSIEDSKITDAGLADISRLSWLRSLGLKGCKEITNAGLVELTKLGELRDLDFGGNAHLNDASLEILARCRKLKELSLASENVIGPGLVHLAQLENLAKLDLGGCPQIGDSSIRPLVDRQRLEELNLFKAQITDKGVRDLARLKSLAVLRLNQTQITDDGVRALANLKKLKTLSLEETQISDAGLAALAEMPQLEELWLGGCSGISDDGLLSLEKAKSLRFLELFDCRNVSDAAIQRARKQLPKCVIRVDVLGMRFAPNFPDFEKLVPSANPREQETGVSPIAIVAGGLGIVLAAGFISIAVRAIRKRSRERL